MEIKPARAKWKGTMTDRERFVNQMNYKPFDRCFNMEFGYWNENFQVWDEFVKNGITNNGQADRFFNFDRMASIGGVIWMSPPFENKVLSETDTMRVLMNGDGLYAEVPKDGHSTIPHYTKSSITTPEDWKRVKEERFNINSLSRIIPSEKIEQYKKQHANRDYPLGVYTGSMIGKIRDMMMFDGLAYAIYDYPEMVEDMVETACALSEHFLKQILPHIEFDYASGWEDICFKNGPIVSVDFFKNVVMPRYKRINKLLKQYGIDLWYTDCDGDVRPLLPYFMEGGINCLFPFEVMGCAHPGELLKEYGKELRIMGGFDKTKMIEGKESIKKYMESLIPCVERGGFIPFCDHRCPPDVTYENYIYYLDLKEQIFGLK